MHLSVEKSKAWSDFHWRTHIIRYILLRGVSAKLYTVLEFLSTRPLFFFQWWADGSPFCGSGFSDNTVYEFHYVLDRLQALCLSAAVRKWNCSQWKCGVHLWLQNVATLIGVWNKRCAFKKGSHISPPPSQASTIILSFGCCSTNTRWLTESFFFNVNMSRLERNEINPGWGVSFISVYFTRFKSVQGRLHVD